MPGWRRLVPSRRLSGQDGRFSSASSHFVLEKIDALPRSKWSVRAPHETWLLLLHGHARVGLLNAFPGEAVFLEDEETTVQAGAVGMQALIAYEASRPDMMMLRPLSGSESHARRSRLSAGRRAFGDVTTSRSLSPRGPTVSQPQRIAFVGNSLPRRCGIATFTTDLRKAVASLDPDIETCIVAMTDNGRTYDYPAEVRLEIGDQSIEDYAYAADVLNDGRYDVVSLQHEFGIFGGEAGDHILTLLNRLSMPVVTTLHTVLSQPSRVQRAVIDRIVAVSSRVVVMAEKGRELLQKVYDVPADKIEVIPHGIPDIAFAEPEEAKARFGFTGKAVILTFGLLSPNKGIEYVIDAMPAILRSRPDAVYVVLGATHPNLVREKGEAYREGLVARAAKLGVSDHVVFLDQFVDQTTLLGFISMCDVYVTPYLNPAQMTSGTLAYSFGLGKAVVSTPYWHAAELLADGRGVLVPFADAQAIGTEIAELLTDNEKRNAMRKRAFATSRSMTWARTAQRYVAAFEHARRDRKLTVLKLHERGAPQRGKFTPPDLRTQHLLSMCDDTGLFQHAVHCVPDRAHGYCVDDNARALLVACALAAPGEEALSDTLTTRFASFIQHAWNKRCKALQELLELR